MFLCNRRNKEGGYVLLHVLEKVNKVYRQNWYLIVAVIIEGLNIFDLVNYTETFLDSAANILLSIVLIMFCYWYINTGRTNLLYFLVQVTMTYLTLFVFVTRRVQLNNFFGFLLTSVGVILIGMTLMVNFKYYK